MWEFLIKYKVYFLIALSVIIPLLAYAVYLQWDLLRNLKADKEKQKNELIARYNEKQADLKESLRIISLAAIQEQCEISEACLRMANLIPLYDKIKQGQEVQAVFDLYEAIKDLKYLEDRKNLNINERFAEDDIRYAAEEKFKDEVLKACEKIYEITRI